MSTTEQQINELRLALHQHNYNYYTLDKPEISDYEFDQLLNKLQQLEAAHPEFMDENSPTQRVGGSITKNFPTVVHENRMYSLANSYSKEDLEDWEKRIEKLSDGEVEYNHKICSVKTERRLSAKI
jgi:DNA ligase (NAD+)